MTTPSAPGDVPLMRVQIAIDTRDQAECSVIGHMLNGAAQSVGVLHALGERQIRDPYRRLIFAAIAGAITHGEHVSWDAVVAQLRHWTGMPELDAVALLEALVASSESVDSANLVYVAHLMARTPFDEYPTPTAHEEWRSRAEQATRSAKSRRPVAAIGGAPERTALYRWFDGDELLLYVGITGNLAVRQNSHGNRSSWSDFATRSTVERLGSRAAAEAAEIAAIRAEHPIFNHQHNDTPEARHRLVAYLVEKGRLDLLAPAVSRG